PSFHLSKDSQPHVLILSFAMIGLWVTGGRAARTRAKNMHEKLVTLLESRMGDWKSQKDFKDTSWPMSTFQAVLLNDTSFKKLRKTVDEKVEKLNQDIEKLQQQVQELQNKLLLQEGWHQEELSQRRILDCKICYG
ncbi:hypothetical protein PENARI_c014G06875, partial [Penicillium arizonense]